MEKIKAVAVALLCHAPGLVLMSAVHVTWELACLAALSSGVATAITTCDRPSKYVWIRLEYVKPISPSGDEAITEELVTGDEEETHEPAQV